MSRHLLLETLEETMMLASLLARLARQGDVITLKGNLGVGKTEFARAFIRSKLGPMQVVQSPTFNLVNVYDELDPPIWHFDLYRLKSCEEIWELGIEEAFIEGITLIEWPERLGDIRLRNHLELTFEIVQNNARDLQVVADSGWSQRLENTILKST